MPFAVGVASSQLLAWFLPLRLLLWLAVVAGSLSLIGRRASIKRLTLQRMGLTVALAGGALGLVSSALWELSVVHIEDGSDQTILVRVLDMPRRATPGALSFVARVLDRGGGVVRCRAVDLAWRNSEVLRRGDVVLVRGDIKGVSKPKNPFSWEGYLYRRGVGGEVRVRYLSAPIKRPGAFGHTIRALIQSAVVWNGDLSRGAALFLSMAFGFRDLLSARVEDAFKGLGLSHILVVSGYQVSLVFGVASGLCSGLSRVLPVSIGLRYLGALSGFIVATLYVSIIGFEMSATRALIAASCVCAGLILDRAGRFGQRWWVALAVMHVVFPWAAYDIGVLLTFAALAGIGVGARIGCGRVLLTWIWVHVTVWLLTSVVVVLTGGELSVIGLFLNLFVPAPWSIFNCTVGIVGLLAVVSGAPGGDSVLQAVCRVNELVASGLLGVYDTVARSPELKEWGGVVLPVAVSCLGALVLIKAARTPSALGHIVRGRGN